MFKVPAKPSSYGNSRLNIKFSYYAVASHASIAYYYWTSKKNSDVLIEANICL